MARKKKICIASDALFAVLDRHGVVQFTTDDPVEGVRRLRKHPCDPYARLYRCADGALLAFNKSAGPSRKKHEPGEAVSYRRYVVRDAAADGVS